MKPHSIPRTLTWMLLALTASGACNCDEQTLVPSTPGTCEPDYACPPGYEYRRGQCIQGRCETDEDCCPGQKCNVAAAFCADQFTGCSEDSECTVPGQACIDFRGGRFCGYPNLGNALSQNGTQSCLSNTDCGPERTCFNRRCVVFAPCDGGCPAGEVCDIDSNTCQRMECNLTCNAGQILVLADPDTMSGPACCLVECACETLPPVRPGQYGWYADIAVTEAQVAVAAYDPQYGDLVVAFFDPSGQPLTVHYVDGFPTSGPIQANPDGPRGGRFEPGPNVGEHASIAADAMGTIHVAYYDRELGRLKYAYYAGGGWNAMVVDDAGDVGLYTSIAIGNDGNPRIAYMMAEGTVPPDPTKRTGLKLATARTNMPGGSADWTTEVVDSVPKPEPICGGGCPSDQACVDLGAGPACRPRNATCMGCRSDEVCVQNGASGSCETEVPTVPLADLIDGTGLFADLAIRSSGREIIAYYDHLAGDLRVANKEGAAWRLDTLDGDDPMSPTDVGQHVSIAVGPQDVVGIAYFDASLDDLVYLDYQSGLREVVDDGVMPPDLRVVGADASLVFDASGRPAIAYQDATQIDLLYARRLGNPPMWSTEILKGSPPAAGMEGTAAGFYAAQERRNDEAFVASVETSFDEESNLLLMLTVFVKNLL